MMKIDSSIPVPERRFCKCGASHELRTAFSKMNHGDSFVWENNYAPFRVAYQIGIKIKTRKINGSGYRVWKIT